MQMSPNDVNEADRQVHRRWTIAFGIVYGTIALVFAGLIVNHPPITTAVVNQVEGIKSAEVTGAMPVVSRRAERDR
jgi:uncharacterized membrane protein HdeD (DUF308 family)